MLKRIELLRSQEVPRSDVVTHPDSMEKILKQISRLSFDPVSYTSDGRTHVYDADVRFVYVSPTMFTRFRCAPGCTACCQKFTLDYPVNEFGFVKDQSGFRERIIKVNGKEKIIYTNDQNENPLCDFLTVERPEGGLGCAHWPFPPLSCASAPQVQIKQPTSGVTLITKKPFDDLESWTPVPQCEFEDVGMDPDASGTHEDIQILARFSEWARYFGIRTCISSVELFLARCIDEAVVPLKPYLVWAR